MTRTERDLRAVLEASEQQAPDPTAVLDALRQRIDVRGRRVRTAARYLAAAVAVGAVAIVPAVLRSSGSGPVGAAASPSDAASAEPSATPTTSPAPAPTVARPFLSFTIRAGDAGNGMRIQPFVITPTRQWALVRQPGVVKGMSAELYVYEPGRLDVARYLTGAALTINGHPGYFATAIDPDTFGTAQPTSRATVVWQYEADSWALVMSTQDTVQRDQLVAIATALVIDAPAAARVPFRVGYLPAGLVAVWMSQGIYDSNNLSASVTFDEPGADVSTIDNDPGLQRPLAMTAMATVPNIWRATMTVAGHPAMRVTARQLLVDVGGWWIELRVATYGTPLPDSELERIVAGLSVANLSDLSTWFDATTAIPGGS